MVMLDTEKARQLARAKHELDNATSICKGYAPTGPQAPREHWERERRRRQRVFLKAAKVVAEELVEARLHELEGP